MSLLETRAGAFTGWTLKHSTYIRSSFSFSFHFSIWIFFWQEFFWDLPLTKLPTKTGKQTKKEKNKTQMSIGFVTPRILNCSSNNQSSSRTTTLTTTGRGFRCTFSISSFFFLDIKKYRKQMFTLTITLYNKWMPTFPLYDVYRTEPYFPPFPFFKLPNQTAINFKDDPFGFCFLALI